MAEENKNETYIEKKARLWLEYSQTPEYKKQNAELKREQESRDKQQADEDKEWETLTQKQKGILYQYGSFLRRYVDFEICRTVSAYWTKQSNFWLREHHKSYETRTTKFRRDEIYWNHLEYYAEQKKMIAGSSWEDKRLTKEEFKVLKKYYDETREKAMNDAIKYMNLHFPNEV
jgi:hypothetical protein